MIVELTRVVDEVTALAEKWKEFALRPWEVNLNLIGLFALPE